MVFPWIAYLEVLGVKGRELSELEFLSIKDFDGKLRKITGSLEANGVIVSLTANTGKDMYIGIAVADGNQDDGTSINQAAGIALVVNGAVVERQTLLVARTVAGTGGGRIEFKSRGFVTAGQTISIDIDVEDSLSHPITATLQCWEEDTGTSPQIPST